MQTSVVALFMHQNLNSLPRFMRQPLFHKKEDEDSILLDLLAADEPDLMQIRNINSKLFMDFTPYRDEELRKSALQAYLVYLRTRSASSCFSSRHTGNKRSRFASDCARSSD